MDKPIKTLQELFFQSVEKYSSNNCLSFVESSPLTYKNFGNQVMKVAGALQNAGIVKGDKVAILSQNMPNWGVAYFSIIVNGAITVPIMPDSSEPEIANIINHSETKVIFVSERMLSKLKSCTISEDILVVNMDDFSVFTSNLPLISKDSLCSVSPDDIATIVYTSGTTGKSKGVVLSHANFCSQLDMIVTLHPMYEYDVYLSFLPLPHLYECSLGLLTNIMVGASTYYLEKPPTPSVLLPALKKIKPTTVLSVPLVIEKIFKNSVYPKLTASPLLKTMYKVPFLRKMMHKKACAELVNVFGGRIRFFGVGGAKLSKQVDRFLIEGKVFPLAIGYGLTETAPMLAGTNPSMVRMQSTGPAVKGTQLKIHNPNPINGEGEIWAKGASIMQGYYKDEVATNAVFEDGWFKTGDIGCLDQDQYLHVKSRIKNVIIGASGENIYPEDIESVINSHKLVNESIVLEQKGNLVAMVQLNTEEFEKMFHEWKDELHVKTDQLMSELKEYVNSKVNKISRVSQVILVTESLERTSTQKVKRFKYVS